MLDTMTLTKTVASLCGGLLVLLLIAWWAEGLYHTAPPYGTEQAYAIDTGEAEGGEAEEVVEVAFADVYAAADAASGERLFRACSSCHSLESGDNGTGPYLYNVVGRPKGEAVGFGYSDAMASQEGEWTPENLDHFIESPRSYTPGTSMSYNGMRDIEDRANLIAYLATFAD